MTYRAVLDACNPVTIAETFACKCGRMFKRHSDMTNHYQYNLLQGRSRKGAKPSSGYLKQGVWEVMPQTL